MMMLVPMLAMEVYVAVSIIVPALVTVGIFLAGLIVTMSRANRAEIKALQIDVAILKEQIKPFWTSLQQKVADALHHPGEEHKELDELLEKLKAMTLTVEEKACLKAVLEKLVDNAPGDTAEKAELLLKIIPMVEKEVAGELPPTDLRSMEQKQEAERVNGAPA